MKDLLVYINPLARLGLAKYSWLFPLLFSITVCVLSEIFAYGIAKNPEIVGVYIIFINVASIIYFAFRDGVRGGFIAAIIPVFYYFYIIYTRSYSGERLFAGIETTLILAALYLILAGVIGWLKQTIDKLINQESDARKRLEAIVEQLPVGVIITDNEAKVVKTNKQLENILGVQVPPGFIIGKDPPVLNGKYKGGEIIPSQSPLASALTSGINVSREFAVERKDGRKIFVQASASPIRNKQGDIIAATSIISDITAQKEMESRKDEFTNMASHELKTPITSIKLYVESLLSRVKQYHDPRLTQSLKSIQYQIEKLQELASDLLDLSRIQTGKLSLKKEKFRLQSLVEETVAELQATTTQHKIKILKKNPAEIDADKFRISQVLTNLLTNAIKYSPRGGDINVKMDKSGSKLVVEVEDHGIGITKDAQEKIFDKLYQVLDPHVKTFPGLGMGLYISKEIIKRHKGRIWVDGKNNGGSVFFFELPVKS